MRPPAANPIWIVITRLLVCDADDDDDRPSVEEKSYRQQAEFAQLKSLGETMRK